ncbi:Crp/Fnr family transcriptional regulator [Enterococcus sp. CSURQ0835]|uniref:Crp/Fnr family transcriptional regulator n=1 Tax=Enterococcus sp. CSURQ0835 TaxID=2681394 RepID=UPI00135CC329|nr:Crp/Fnr family transcriptional regulator [Enterococcus sp. CSURQ0835]
MIQEKLTSVATPLSFTTGETILELEQATHFFYFIRSGEVAVSENLLSGQQTLLKFLQAGDCFGEIELFAQTKNYEVTATQDCQLLQVAYPELEMVMKQDFELTRYVIEQVIKKLSASSENLVRQSLMTTYDRCLVKIYEYYRTGQLATLSKEKLAQEVNTTLRSVNRALERFQQKKWLSYQTKTIRLLEPQQVANYLSKNWGIFISN